MRKYLYILLVSVFIFGTGCEEFLEEVPKSSISPANFYKTADDAKAAVNAAYAAIATDNYYGRYQITASAHTGEAVFTRLTAPSSDRMDIAMLYDARMITNSRYNRNLWNQTWKAVNDANAVIDNVPNIDMDATLQAQIIGEAKFLRALSYFNMVRRWGGVPIVLNETNTSILSELQLPKNSATEVYAQIEQDLTDAIAALPKKSEYSSSDIGRACEEAAQGLLAKVQLYQQKWSDAKTNAVAVVNNSSGIDLMQDPKDLWWESSDHDNNKESLFEVQYNGVSPNNHSVSQNFEANGNGWGPGNWGSIHANMYFYGKFSDTDKRKATTFYIQHPNRTTGETVHWYQFTYPSPHVAKYREPEHFSGNENNIRVLRFADVLLVAAEATNESEGPANAVQYINRVRFRAGIPDLPTSISKDALRDSIYLEFRRELCYEGQDYEELVRTGRLLSEKIASCTYTIPPMLDDDGNVLTPTQTQLDRIALYQPQLNLFELDAHNVLWPFPQDATDKNPNLQQNPGYPSN